MDVCGLLLALSLFLSEVWDGSPGVALILHVHVSWMGASRLRCTASCLLGMFARSVCLPAIVERLGFYLAFGCFVLITLCTRLTQSVPESQTVWGNTPVSTCAAKKEQTNLFHFFCEFDPSFQRFANSTIVCATLKSDRAFIFSHLQYTLPNWVSVTYMKAWQPE